MNFREICENWQDATKWIDERWSELVRCEQILRWDVIGDMIVIDYELFGPCGGGGTDRVPLACFEEKDLEKAKAIYAATK